VDAGVVGEEGRFQLFFLTNYFKYSLSVTWCDFSIDLFDCGLGGSFTLFNTEFVRDVSHKSINEVRTLIREDCFWSTECTDELVYERIRYMGGGSESQGQVGIWSGDPEWYVYFHFAW